MSSNEIVKQKYKIDKCPVCFMEMNLISCGENDLYGSWCSSKDDLEDNHFYFGQGNKVKIFGFDFYLPYRIDSLKDKDVDVFWKDINILTKKISNMKVFL